MRRHGKPARAVGAAWLMGEGTERRGAAGRGAPCSALRSIRPALPILLPALLARRHRRMAGKPLAYWWAARTGRY